MVKRHLSKTLYLKATQCNKALWLVKHRKELRLSITEEKQALFDAGHRVGALAQKLFPKGRHIGQEAQSIPERLALTSDLISHSKAPLYEATFQAADMLIMADIIVPSLTEPNTVYLYEVKSSTSVKDVHLQDIALQYYILKENGLTIKKASIIHINLNYKRGWFFNVKNYFKTVDVTEHVLEILPKVSHKIDECKAVIQEKNEPPVDIGYQCEHPYECDYKPYCWKHIPNYSIFNLTGLPLKAKLKLYQNNILEFKDIPNDYKLTKAQELQIRVHAQERDYVDKDRIKQFIATLSYPLYFLDFETVQVPIPPFRKTTPYRPIPFQFSLHIANSPEDMAGAADKVTHFEFLAPEGKDPRKRFVKALTKLIPKDACVLVFSAGFEKSILSVLAQQYPLHRKKLMRIHSQIHDLMIPFQKRYIHTKEMLGKHSIKSILPALVPDMGYQSLDICNGQMATHAYARLHLIDDIDHRKKLKEQLLEYCKLDTFAMVKILDKLYSYT